MDDASNFGQDRERVRIPLQQDLVGLYRRTLFDEDARAVDHVVAFLLAALVIDQYQFAVAVHGDQIAILVAHGLDSEEARETIRLRVLRRLFGNTSRRSADVERTHGELRAGLADGLRRNDAHRFAALDQPSGRQVASVAGHAHAAFRFASQHGANLDALNAGGLNQASETLSDFLIHADDYVAFEIFLIFERYAANDAVAQRLNDFAGFDNGFDEDAFGGAAIILGDDHILRNVNQAPREVTGIGRLERRIRQTLAGA